MRSSKPFIAAVVAGVLTAIVVVAWWVSGSSTTERSVVDATREPHHATSRTDVELAATELEVAAAPRRAIESTSEDLAAGAEVMPDSARAAPVLVRVTVADNPWLESDWNGSLAWSDSLGGDDEVRVVNGYMQLPRAPRSSAQFSNLDFAGLVAQPLGLTRIDPADRLDDRGYAPAFELATQLASGARLEWDPRVPSGERSAVRVVLGSTQPPRNSNWVHRDTNGRIVDESFEVELPFVLPRVVVATSLWIGATGRQWRSHLLATDETRIDVLLEPTATIRVLHDGSPGEVVVLGPNVTSETSMAVRDTRPIVVADLPAGEHRVWIRAPASAEPKKPVVPWAFFDDAQSRIARITLVAGQTTEVDLRAASILDGRGGLRVLVRTPNTEPPLHDRALEPSVWSLATSTQKRTHSPGLRLVSKSEQGNTFEVLGLEPGRHIVYVPRFAACVEFVAVPGEVASVVINLDCIGRVRFEWPSDLRGLPSPPESVQLELVLTSGQSLVWFTSGVDTELVCGTYSARMLASGENSDFALVTDSFIVESGVTTVVPIRFEPVQRVVFTAIESSTGAPLTLGRDFWRALDVRDRETDAEIVAHTRHLDGGGSHSGVEWTLHPHAEPVRFAVPHHPLWTFEPLEPRVLEDGGTITLRGTAK